MDLRQVRYFLNLADTLNFTRAAELSRISQPSLTRAIQRLENELGGQLVYRDGKDTRLTELGRTIRGEFERIVSSEMRARELAERIVGEARTIVSIGVASVHGPAPVWPFLSRFLGDMPQVEAVVTTINPDMAAELVLSGSLDACICPGPLRQHDKLQATPLYRERLLLMVAIGHRLAAYDSVPPAEISREAYVDRVNCAFRKQVIDHFMDHDVLMRPQLQSDREDWVQHAVAKGFGVAMAPEYSPVRDDVCLRPVTSMHLGSDVALLTIAGSPTAPAVRRLREAATAYPWPASKL